jgi:carboxypeptidase Taq
LSTLANYRDHLAEIGKLGSAAAVLGWDLQTHMPPKGAPYRGQVQGKLARMTFELATADALGTYLTELGKDESLTPLEKASVRQNRKAYDRARAVPAQFVEERQIAQSEAQGAWIEARRTNNYALFQPHLEKMVGFARRLAEYYGYKEHPYDALLEDFEPGLTCRQLRAIIEPLRSELVPFLHKLTAEGTAPDASVLDGHYDADALRRLSHRALEIIGYDFEAGALDDVAHPFTMTVGPGDVRITNRYPTESPTPSLYGALHEGGHALYNQGFPAELFALGLANGSSNGIHESQSRMIENQVGRSRPFWQFFQPVLAEYFPKFAAVPAETLYRACNVVAPSLIRVEADEVTYNLHIMLRFEIEAGLVEGSIDVAGLPKRWNQAMKDYLGVVPPNDSVGVLQDVHWSLGYVGYFPSYMLGNLYAAQMLTTIRRSLPRLDDDLRKGNLKPLLGWLRENVHQHGAAYEPDELMKRLTGEPLDSAHFVRYVKEKYGDIYQL